MVVFDLGGVVLEIAPSWQVAAKWGKAKVGIPNTPELDTSGPKAIEDYHCGAIPDEQYLSALAEYLQTSPEHAKRAHNGMLGAEYPGILSLISELKAYGIPVACLSNTNHLHWVELHDELKYPGFCSISLKVASHNLKMQKPDLAIYREFEAISKTPASDLVFFDDRIANVQTALQAGWNAVQIDPLAKPPQQMRKVLQELALLPS